MEEHLGAQAEVLLEPHSQVLLQSVRAPAPASVSSCSHSVTCRSALTLSEESATITGRYSTGGKLGRIGHLQDFTAEDDRGLSGHLVLYPICVSPSGEVSPLPGADTFPDTAALVCGATSNLLPEKLTT